MNTHQGVYIRDDQQHFGQGHLKLALSGTLLDFVVSTLFLAVIMIRVLLLIAVTDLIRPCIPNHWQHIFRWTHPPGYRYLGLFFSTGTLLATLA